MCDKRIFAGGSKMAYKFTEKKDNKQQHTTYALYMIISSYFHKSICCSKCLETKLHLYYQELPFKSQEELEEKLIQNLEKELGDMIPVFEMMNCKTTIKRYQEEYCLIFETGFEDMYVIIDKKGSYKIKTKGERME